MEQYTSSLPYSYAVTNATTQREVVSYDPPEQFLKVTLELANIFDDRQGSALQIWVYEDGFWVPLYGTPSQERSLVPMSFDSSESVVENNRKVLSQIGGDVLLSYKYWKKRMRLHNKVKLNELETIKRRVEITDSAVNTLSEPLSHFFHLAFGQGIPVEGIAMRLHVGTATVFRMQRDLKLELGYVIIRSFSKVELDQILGDVDLLKLRKRRD